MTLPLQKMLIDGQWVEARSGRSFETRNPVYESSVDTPGDYRALFVI